MTEDLLTAMVQDITRGLLDQTDGTVTWAQAGFQIKDWPKLQQTKIENRRYDEEAIQLSRRNYRAYLTRMGWNTDVVR